MRDKVFKMHTLGRAAVCLVVMGSVFALVIGMVLQHALSHAHTHIHMHAWINKSMCLYSCETTHVQTHAGSGRQ